MQRCASLQGKRIHPHLLSHSCAMSLLQADVDSTVIALGSDTPTSASTQSSTSTPT
jgi:site-specific recombinase XerD